MPELKYFIVGIFDHCITIRDMGRACDARGFYSYVNSIVGNEAQLLRELGGHLKTQPLIPVPPRRLFYYDGDSKLTEILYRDGKFIGYGESPSPRLTTP
jgi:hypothetical protein